MPLPITVDVPLLLVAVPDEPVPLLLPEPAPLKPLLEEVPELLPEPPAERVPELPAPDPPFEPDPAEGELLPEVAVGAVDDPLVSPTGVCPPASSPSEDDVTSPVAQPEIMVRTND